MEDPETNNNNLYDAHSGQKIQARKKVIWRTDVSNIFIKFSIERAWIIWFNFHWKRWDSNNET